MAEKADGVVVSVVMPAYNEERSIEECFHGVVKVLKDYGEPFEIILEEDGSTDGTPRIIDRLAAEYPFVEALHYQKRMGKGFGVRRGLEAARGKIILLIDADMEYPPESIPQLLDLLKRSDIAIGERTGSNYRTRLSRRLASTTYRLLLRLLFGVDGLRDPQSGLKAYTRRVIEAVQPLDSNGFEIDTEILIKALRKGYRVEFVPVTYNYKGNSKVNILLDSLKMFLALLNFWTNGRLIALETLLSRRTGDDKG